MTTSPIHREALSELEGLAKARRAALTRERHRNRHDMHAAGRSDTATVPGVLLADLEVVLAAARERDALRAALERIAGDEKPELGNRNTNDLLARMYWEYATAALSPRSETSPDKKEG